jgi:hypothetical protein
MAWTAVLVVMVGLQVLAVVLRGRRLGRASGSQVVIDTRTLQLQPFSLVSGDPPKTEVIPMNPPDQYAVQVQLRNTGDREIEADAYDGPVVVTLGMKAAVLRHTSVNGTPPLAIGPLGAEAALPPVPIPAGADWRWILHVIGAEPIVSIRAPWSEVGVDVRPHPRGTAPAMITMGLGGVAWFA